MGVKVLRDAKSRPYVAIVNGRIQRVRPKERYWALAEEAEARRSGTAVRASARAVSPSGNGHGVSDDEPPQQRAAWGSNQTAGVGGSGRMILLPAPAISFPPLERLDLPVNHRSGLHRVEASWRPHL